MAAAAAGPSELAAVFARRAAKTNDGASTSSAAKPPLSPPANDNSNSVSSTISSLNWKKSSSHSPPNGNCVDVAPLLTGTPSLPKSTTSNQCGTAVDQQSYMASPSSPVATKSRNIHSDEERAKFEARNLEAGIPTPSFLANARKNLRKPGSERTLDNSTTTSKVEHIDQRQIDADDGQSKELTRNVSSIEKTRARTLDAVNRTPHPRFHSIASSTESAPIDEETDHLPQRNQTRSKSDAALQHETLSARRTRMVESRSKESSSLVAAATAKKKTSSTKSSASGSIAAVTPGNVRREKLLARVRASKSNKTIEPINKGHPLGTAFDATKLSITSPTKDEFEVLFADELEKGNQTADLIKNESIDSLTHEMANLNHSTSTHDSATTIQTNNVTSTEGLNPRLTSNQYWNVTPSRSKDRHEQRIANASTPKIRGAYRRENFEPVQSTAHQQQKQIPLQSQSLPTIQCSQESDILNILPSPHGQQKHPDTSNLNLTQPYSLKERTPSQLSQLSAITTPSCFPQDIQVPSQSNNNRGLGHLQQPMLVGVTIEEAASFEGNTCSSNTPSNMPRDPNSLEFGSSALESTLENENARLREQLSTMSKRVEEKDAIISQLMKRIADLESTERAIAKGANMAAMTSSSLTPRSNPVTLLSPMSISGSALWTESSQLSQPNSAFHSFRSSSVDTESAQSVPSSTPLVAGSRTESAAGADLAMSPTAPGSSSLPSTPAQRVKLRSSSTASTASVTTSASGRSAKLSKSTSTRRGRNAVDSADKPKTRSRSVGGSSRRRRRSKKVADHEERKFVC
ncbi:hypothetical protein THAOC_05274 [Thalassiosira oceanica]|uniref:Uncharacterized protein n=1 Tax=Thalassiosira oceanica TaxID=159749 RepID=K0THJ0_THAOC|nr:hypothetical protein THAOC_05274 [Thalassiosira oceanica]|eukprot:EJK73121.1 hypothetical protein THAOC_05274 [Thalassiosira oceanica]